MKSLKTVNRRIWILVNYLSLSLLISGFIILKDNKLGITYTALLFVFALILIVSYYFSFVKTGLWKFTHTDLKSLDEREIKIIYLILRKSYLIFVIIAIVGMYIEALTKIELFNVVTSVGFIYLAHILPGTVLGWKEQEILL